MSGAVDDFAELTISWRQLLRETSSTLAAAGLDSPEVDARRLIECVSGIEPGALHVSLDEPATRRGVARLDGLIARRIAGEPLQYVIARWGFRTVDLLVDRRVLIPRPETEVVADLAISAVDDRAAAGREVLVVDLGTGSGAIALAVAAECPTARVLATDRSSEALAVARANLAGLGRAATRVSTHVGEWFRALPGELRGRVDVVVSNPPYVADDEALPPEVADWEPPGALRAGPRGTEQIERIIDDAPRWLVSDGTVIIEMAPHQTEPMADRARARGFEVAVVADLAGRPRAVVARR